MPRWRQNRAIFSTKYFASMRQKRGKSFYVAYQSIFYFEFPTNTFRILNIRIFSKKCKLKQKKRRQKLSGVTVVAR